MPETSNDCDSDRPVDKPRCEDFDREAETKVPEELTRLEAMPELEPFKLIALTADDLNRAKPDPIEANIPAWSAVRVQPAPTLRQDGYRSRVRFRGRELQPGSSPRSWWMKGPPRDPVVAL